MAFETRFWIKRRNNRRSERTTKAQGMNVSSSPFAAASGENSSSICAQHFVDTETGEFRPHCPGIKTRHIQERAEDFLNGFERSIDIVDQAAVVLSSTLNEAGDIKSCSIKWLQDVVTCRREELGLGDIRGFGLTFGARERGIEQGQFLRTLLNAPFQSLVRALKCFCRLDARRDVGECGRDGAIRHTV